MMSDATGQWPETITIDTPIMAAAVNRELSEPAPHYVRGDLCVALADEVSRLKAENEKMRVEWAYARRKAQGLKDDDVDLLDQKAVMIELVRLNSLGLFDEGAELLRRAYDALQRQMGFTDLQAIRLRNIKALTPVSAFEEGRNEGIIASEQAFFAARMKSAPEISRAILALIPAPAKPAREGGDTITITVPRRLLPEMVQWAEDELSHALEDTAFDRDLRRALEVLRALDPAKPTEPTLAGVLHDLAQRQQPLDPEFDQALEAGREGLYEP